MRTLFLALTIMASGLAHAIEGLPELPPGTPYSKARTSLMKFGWRPGPLPEDRHRMCPPDDQRCHDYPEASACSGTSRALCTFTWRRNGQVIEVDTYGKEDLSIDRVRVLKN